MEKNILFFLCFLFFHLFSCYADKPSQIIESFDSFKLKIIEDKASSFNPIEVLSMKNFIEYNSKVPNLGVSNSTWWIKLKVENNTKENDLLLEYSYPIIDEITFYKIYNNIIVDSVKLGEIVPFHSRKYKYNNYIFDLNLNPYETADYLVKIKSGEQIMVPIKIGTSSKIINNNNNRNILFGVYAGVMLVMFLYNIFIYFSVKDESYLFYVLHTFIIGFTQAAFLGYTFQYLWPDNTWLSIQSTYILTCLVAIVGTEFFKSFLLTKKFTPFLHYLSYLFEFLLLVSILTSLMGEFKFTYKLIQIVQASLTTYILVTAIIILRKGYRPAKFYLIAWSTLLIGVYMYFMKDFGVLPYNDYTVYTMAVGSALETILLSFALADRINIMRKEKHEAQKRELEERLEKQLILEKQAETLKIEVEKATKSLKEAQVKLIQSEKMASLGQFAAGMSHEINNMMNISHTGAQAVEKNITHLKEYVVEIEKLESQVKESKELREEMEIDEVYESIDDSIELVKNGIDRAVAVTKKLKNFSKVDNLDNGQIDLNKDIEDVLDIQRGNLLKNIQIETSFEKIPLARGNSNEMNECIVSVIENAVYAIQEKKLNDNEGLIKISTSFFDGKVIVAIEDNGVGIPEKAKDKIFDIFFTTKPVGNQGIGLSNVYATIKKMHGEIEVDSKENKGTTIRLIIPVE